MAVVKAALQASTAQLAANALFADSSGLLIAHKGLKFGNFSRDLTLATGQITVSGVGFQPVGVIFFAELDNSQVASWGLDDGAGGHTVIYANGNNAGKYAYYGGSSILFLLSGGGQYEGYITSLNSDGFVIQWTKTGLPTGTGIILYAAWR